MTFMFGYYFPCLVISRCSRIRTLQWEPQQQCDGLAQQHQWHFADNVTELIMASLLSMTVQLTISGFFQFETNTSR